MSEKIENECQLLSSKELASEAREARKNRDMTQQQVADMLVRSGVTKSCTKQAISQAENPQTGSNMDGLRIKIIEKLIECKLSGPYWYFDSAE